MVSVRASHHRRVKVGLDSAAIKLYVVVVVCMLSEAVLNCAKYRVGNYAARMSTCCVYMLSGFIAIHCVVDVTFVAACWLFTSLDECWFVSLIYGLIAIWFVWHRTVVVCQFVYIYKDFANVCDVVAFVYCVIDWMVFVKWIPLCALCRRLYGWLWGELHAIACNDGNTIFNLSLIICNNELSLSFVFVILTSHNCE